MERTLREAARHDYWNEWDKIECSILVVVGEQGIMPKSSGEVMTGRNAHSQLVEIAGRATTFISIGPTNGTGCWSSSSTPKAKLADDGSWTAPERRLGARYRVWLIGTSVTGNSWWGPSVIRHYRAVLSP